MLKIDDEQAIIRCLDPPMIPRVTAMIDKFTLWKRRRACSITISYDDRVFITACLSRPYMREMLEALELILQAFTEIKLQESDGQITTLIRGRP